MGNSNYLLSVNMCAAGSRRRGGRLCGRVLAGPAGSPTVWRPEVDGVGGTADLQFLPQCFRRRGKPAPECLGRLARSGFQLARLSRPYALDVPDIFLKQRRARLSGNELTGRVPEALRGVS